MNRLLSVIQIQGLYIPCSIENYFLIINSFPERNVCYEIYKVQNTHLINGIYHEVQSNKQKM